MRALPLFGALLVGLALCGTAAAQNTSNLYKNNYTYSGSSTTLYQQTYAQNVSKRGNVPTNTSLGQAFSGAFSPRTLFDRFQSPRPRSGFEPLGTNIPNPETDKAAYLQAIGLRPLR